MDKIPLTSAQLPERSKLSADLIAGLTFAVVSVPQAMGNALLATVNPVLGLNTLMVATPVGALFTSSVFMNISTTSALSVAVGDALYYVPADQKTAALITLVILVGLFQLLFGLLRLGSLMRFVSHAVMIGFATGLGVLIIMGQIGGLTGYQSAYNNKVLRLADLLLNLDQIDTLSLAVGLSTIALIFGFGATRLNKFAMALALVIMTGLTALLALVFQLDSLLLIGDIAVIPRSLPGPASAKIIPIPMANTLNCPGISSARDWPISPGDSSRAFPAGDQ